MLIDIKTKQAKKHANLRFWSLQDKREIDELFRPFLFFFHIFRGAPLHIFSKTVRRNGCGVDRVGLMSECEEAVCESGG